MAYFSHSASTDRSRSRGGRGKFRRDRTRFTPAADFLEVRALLSTLVVAEYQRFRSGLAPAGGRRRAERQHDSVRE